MRSHRNDVRVRPVKFRVSTNLLDHLGLNMYSSVPKAISEVVVNGWDADATIVTVSSSPEEVTIEDNGSGMDENDIQDEYMVLASGHKRRRGRTPLGREPIGAKGIGKLAGLGIAKRFEVETWRGGRMYSFAIDREEMEAVERANHHEALLDRALMQLTETRSTESSMSGTRVRLTKLRPEARFDSKKVREHLAQELPLGQTFRVYVDGQQLRKDEIKGRYIVIRHDDPVCGRIEGRIVVANSAVRAPGVITTVRGRAVGGPSFFELILANRRYHSTDRIAGQVEVSGLDPDDGSPTAIKTDLEGFLTSHPRYQAFSRFMTDKLKEIAQELEDANDKQRDDKRRASLGAAVKKAADLMNAYNQHSKRLLQLGKAKTAMTGERDESSDTLLPRPVVEIEEQGGTRHPVGEEQKEPPDLELVPVRFGSGRLRFRDQTFQVRIDPLGHAADECQIRREESAIVVNQDHPSYEEAEKNHWTEGIVVRAIATKLACEFSSTADEAYSSLDEILRFVAKHSKRRGASAVADDADEFLAPAV